MNKNITLIIAVIVIVVVAVAAYMMMQPANQQPTDNNQNNEQPTNGENPAGSIEPTELEVIYTDTGYSPKELKVKVGDTVTFSNTSTGTVWTASAMHPNHTVYAGTSLQEHCQDPNNKAFDQCKAEGTGTNWTFTFDKAGTWRYHNHAQAAHFGSIIVE